MLDFFGVPVKAQDLLNLLAQVRLLAKRLEALEASGQQLPRSFRLDAASTPPQAKWGRAVGWEPRDDAMLLLGVYWHGVGHWEAIVRDERLGLGAKLASVLAPAAPAAAPATPAGTPPPAAAGGGDKDAAAAAAGDGGGGDGGVGGGKSASPGDKEKELLPKGGVRAQGVRAGE
jgi:hypothetical protein